MMAMWPTKDFTTALQAKSHPMAELFEWSVVVDGQEIERA